MKLRTRLNLLVTGLTAAFAIVLILLEVQTARASVREEIAAANRVAVQLLTQVAGSSYASAGGTDQVQLFLQQLGRVRANEITLRSASGEELYRSPPSTWKAGREAPQWFSKLLMPKVAWHVFPLQDGAQMIVEPVSSRAILDA